MTPDPLIETPAFRQAVEMAKEAWHKPPSKGPNGTGYLAGNWEEKLEASIAAALPAIRKGLAEELRAMPTTTSSRGNTFGAGWLSAADHLEGQ